MSKQVTINTSRQDGTRTSLKSDAVHLDATKIEEDDDYWSFPDSGLSAAGVFNRGLRRAEDLSKTWMLMEGIPFTHMHPDLMGDEMGLVVDMRRVGGWLTNVRFDDATGRIIGDVYLAKRPLDGLAITPAALKQNELLVAAVKGGEDVEVSAGYFSTDEFATGEEGGREYDHIRREFMWHHVAAVPMGACGWDDGCGLGRAQGADSSQAPLGDQTSTTHSEDQKMTQKSKQDCADDAQGGPSPETPEGGSPATPPAQQDTKALTALEARLDAIEKENKRLREDAEKETKQRLDTKRTELAKLMGHDEDKIPDTVQKLDETALDLMIEREKQYRGKADNARIGGSGGNSYDPKGDNVTDGIARTAQGLTVVDWGALPQENNEAFPGMSRKTQGAS